MSEEQIPRRTPLYDTHARHGGRFVPFAGWEMPVRYDSIIREAEAVRTNAGLFDVSHMGRVEFEGVGAASLLDSVLSVNVQGMRTGRAHYNVICDQKRRDNRRLHRLQAWRSEIFADTERLEYGHGPGVDRESQAKSPRDFDNQRHCGHSDDSLPGTEGARHGGEPRRIRHFEDTPLPGADCDCERGRDLPGAHRLHRRGRL